jgi:hypothetical protein
VLEKKDLHFWIFFATHQIFHFYAKKDASILARGVWKMNGWNFVVVLSYRLCCVLKLRSKVKRQVILFWIKSLWGFSVTKFFWMIFGDWVL